MYILDSKAPTGAKPWELGTGPFTVKPGTNPSNNNLDLVAFNKWHGGHSYTRALDYIFYADPAKAVSDLEAGKINLADEISLQNENANLKNNYHIFTGEALGVNALTFDTKNPAYPTYNIKIRQALGLAINNQEVMTQSQQTGTPVNQIVPPSLPGYSTDIPTIKQNIQEAAALVKQAGYPNGVTINLGVGEPILNVAQEIAKEVKPAGININIQEATDEGQFFNTIGSGGYQSWIAEFPTAVIDGTDILQAFEDSAWYHNSTFDQELNSAQTTFNADQRLTDLQAASLTLSKNSAYVPLYQLSNLNVGDKNIVVPFVYYDSDLNTFFPFVYQK